VAFHVYGYVGAVCSDAECCNLNWICA